MATPDYNAQALNGHQARPPGIYRGIHGIVAALVLLLTAGPLPAAPLDLWFYYSSNLAVDKNIDLLKQVWGRAAAAGYSHVLLSDSKFSRLGNLGGGEAHYLANIARVRGIGAELKLQIVPAIFPIGYSNDLLAANPNLAEGLPVKDALFVVHGGRARLQADPPVDLGRPSFVDADVKVGGDAAMVADPHGNARMVWPLNLPRFRCYHVWGWVKSDHFSGRPQIKVLAGDVPLQFQSAPFKATENWTRFDVIFNTLEQTKLQVYLGVWGGAKGTLWWKDCHIEEAGLVNVLRREGTPCVVRSDDDGRVYQEGRDYEPISDPGLAREGKSGEYQSWRDPPPIVTSLPEGTRLRVSWYHPAIVYDGQTTICFNEPAAQRLLAEQAGRMKAAWGAGGYMMSHDEIRVMGWDESCRAMGKDAGGMLADDARFCRSLLSGSTIYVWSDMFDPFHNAHKNYYLVRGDLAGSWEGLSRDVVMLNWNFDKRDSSLKFFADRGHRQILAGYYDGPVNGIDAWLESAAKVSGVVGVMYTTWERRYADLEGFAREVRAYVPPVTRPSPATSPQP